MVCWLWWCWSHREAEGLLGRCAGVGQARGLVRDAREPRPQAHPLRDHVPQRPHRQRIVHPVVMSCGRHTKYRGLNVLNGNTQSRVLAFYSSR